MRARRLVLLLGLLAAGCGGGRAHGGQVAIGMVWPSGSGRVIPTATQSIQVQILQGATVVNAAILTPASPTTTIADVPVGSVTVKALAYPNANATGTALASAQTIQTVSSASTTNVSLTMASTIDHMTITPNPINLALAGVLTRQVTVTAYDASNAVILTSPGDLSFSSSGLSVFIVNAATGYVTGLAVGTATLTATDAVSGLSATATVHITAV